MHLLEQAVVERVRLREATDGEQQSSARARYEGLLAKLDEGFSPTVYYFDERLHPRNRLGEFVDVLGALKSKRDSRIAVRGGVTVGRSRLGGFVIRKDGREVGYARDPKVVAAKTFEVAGLDAGSVNLHAGSTETRRLKFLDTTRVEALAAPGFEGDGKDHLRSALDLVRKQIATAERRRPRDVAGADADAPKRQLTRLREREARLLKLLAGETTDARIEKLLAEHKRMYSIWQRNLDKQFAPDTKPRSRFTYASHVTKATNKLARIESDLLRAGVKIPTYSTKEAG